MTKPKSPEGKLSSAAGHVEVTKTFAACFCVRRQITPAGYARTVLRETYYPHARLLVPILNWFWPDFSTADRELVDEVAFVTSRKTLESAIHDFQLHVGNRGYLRQTLRVRISVRKFWRLMNEIFPNLETSSKSGDGRN